MKKEKKLVLVIIATEPQSTEEVGCNILTMKLFMLKEIKPAHASVRTVSKDYLSLINTLSR
ncbi:hypothetical protein, partial [Tritonibacter sp. SIMBA_163]|uniref:hypothetical protein n=1 Tax=Tritonibacter sp. SIMBA_163 TaxID=3080868 RepID=UPI00397F6D5C